MSCWCRNTSICGALDVRLSAFSCRMLMFFLEWVVGVCVVRFRGGGGGFVMGDWGIRVGASGVVEVLGRGGGVMLVTGVGLVAAGAVLDVV